MNFTIFSIDDSRLRYTQGIRAQLRKNFWWDEKITWCIDGRDSNMLSYVQDIHPLPVNAKLRRGQLGIWYTVLNALRDFGEDNLVTFEDDAILNESFDELFWSTTTRLPRGTDAFSLFLPRDQDHTYYANQLSLNVAPGICRAYQRYGGVSMLWTPKGAKKFQSLVARDGITDQWDDQLYKYAQSGEMDVYTQPPTESILVSISGTETSIVQESELM